MSWEGDIELEARDLPDWAAAQPLTWTISSGQGSFMDMGGNRVKYFGPQWGPEVPTKTVIHLYAGDEIVGEATITHQVIMPKITPEPLPGLPKEPEPDPPPTEEEVVPTVDCGVDPENPEEPLKIRPTEVMVSPLERLDIGIIKIWEACEEGCYTWKISSGGGKLLCNCGRKAIYEAPRINAMCEDNAVIDLIYCERVIASCYVTINTWGRGGLAYVVFEKVKIEGMDSTPGWSPQKPKPPPAGVLSPRWYIVGRAQRYDCQDEPLQPLRYLHIECNAAWSMFADRWIIYVGEDKDVGGTYYELDEIPMHKLWARHPAKTVDSRTKWMKQAGCCPVGLFGLAYFFE